VAEHMIIKHETLSIHSLLPTGKEKEKKKERKQCRTLELNKDIQILKKSNLNSGNEEVNK
jgi:hypothetical protein